jgi:hypothetical protein
VTEDSIALGDDDQVSAFNGILKAQMDVASPIVWTTKNTGVDNAGWRDASSFFWRTINPMGDGVAG